MPSAARRPAPPPPPPASPPRAVPAQARSRERYERILDAATAVFAEVGYEAATTEAIAERAATSIGSVYRFFPNKLALFQALIPRYLDQVRAIFEALVVEGPPATSWQALAERAIDAFAAYDLKTPVFRVVWMSLKVTDQLLVEGDLVNREFARRLELAFASLAPSLEPARRRVVATVVVELVSTMLAIAALRGRDLAPQIVDETKKVVIRYLEPYMAPPPVAAAERGAGRGGEAPAGRQGLPRPRRQGAAEASAAPARRPSRRARPE
ncbi:MAG TPA: TetR/AcrR family transcriptional regulator [Polyangiaceae bacterium]|nr:TetR/AcrR family transcriptional regulator [Polyangiaceae bacterium]